MKQLSVIEVEQGDDTDFWDVYIEAVPLEKLSCRQALYLGSALVSAVGVVEVTSKTPDEDQFRCFWTPAQTALLAPGEYHWVVQLTGDETVDPPLNRELRRKLCVLKQLLV